MKVKQNAFGNFHVLFRSTCTLRGYGNTVPPKYQILGALFNVCGGWGMWVLTFMSLLRHILSTPDEP